MDGTDEFATLSSLTLLPGQLKLKVGVVSVRGNYREHNEDNYYVPGRRPVRPDLSDGSAETPAMTLEPENLFIVADGMGGQQAGEKASLMAVELIPRAIARRLTAEEKEPRQIQESIREAVAEVNSEILGSSGLVTEYSNMGTTVVLAQFRQDRVFVAGIGDSRAYRLRDNKLEQLTKDHSLADALLDAGTITKEELSTHKFKNVLYLYLGSKDAQRARGVQSPRRSTRRSVSAGQRWTYRSRSRRRAGQGAVHGERPPAGGRDAQGHGPGQRLQGQRHLPDHQRGGPERPVAVHAMIDERRSRFSPHRPTPGYHETVPAWELGGRPAHGLVRSSRATESSKVTGNAPARRLR